MHSQRLLVALGLGSLLLTPAAAQEATPDEAPSTTDAAPAESATLPRTAIGPPALPEGTSREQMWWAPTAEDWAQPCRITWQRSWEDAIAISLETSKPILVCVNMDGEIASEHYAGVRWRQPEIAALYKPYVTVVASVYRHTPRDHDEQGNRLLCPRFGSVTCGEHIAIEPILYDQYFEGERVSPRHIMIELDASEVYDVYYAYDTDSVFGAIRSGILDRDVPVRELSGDRTLLERVRSRDVDDRALVERAYREGDHAQRRALIEAAVAAPQAAQVELLRLALFGEDAELQRLAWNGLTESDSDSAVPLVADALRHPMAPEEQAALVSTLERIGESSERARKLATVFRGLSGGTSVIDVSGWSEALSVAEAEDDLVVSARLEYRAEATVTDPLDGLARLELAEAFLDRARHPETEPRFVGLLLEDAHRAALEAAVLGAPSWRVDTVLALSAEALGDRKQALARSLNAVDGRPPTSSDELPGLEELDLLELFVEARQDAIVAAVRAREEWPDEWLADVNAAYAVLTAPPRGDDSLVARHHGLLMWLGAHAEANRVLDAGLVRFPASWVLHSRLRQRLLAERDLTGLDGLESVYENMLLAEGASPELRWYAGYSALVVAEYHRRASEPESALSAYVRAQAHFETWIEGHEATRASADHYIAMAQAGEARLALEAGDLELAVNLLLQAFERAPQSAGTLDGLGLSAISTARALEPLLAAPGNEGLERRLQDALGSLPPEAFELPVFERESRGRGPSADARRAARRLRGEGGGTSDY